MDEKHKSQKGFVAVTVITVLAIALVLMVYATFLGTFTGGEVVYDEGLTAEVLYATNNQTGAGNWSATLNVTSAGPWYALLNITSTNGYIGEVNVTFQLQRKVGSNWNDEGTPTYAVLNLNGTAGERVYVSSDGTITTNRNWQGDCASGNSYRVKATVDSTG